ncbi:CDP-diacylglycerol--glycerol-3-phosphate 3-phosphatidyltransferase [Tautonia plasticadhaerens]|uniref:CDP-diacylglycerol--glycerol-3-phosphate 3-phosphatidyltransferase n=1 Tax=Tautonia plasticadhaerens TaxID=2527974 RepID=A0A518GXE9_9BACT|nr:CDP-diacylglycerol--glycerol-3-phosphate 3-phosphatidyltransferase [Tautonia plasticadhaerens]QDV33259.1 CDP-diacylglycerol--glycerol-3-phosphate 3-phosphatidyltransferase [Tautonia plasticadhaerens]
MSVEAGPSTAKKTVGIVNIPNALSVARLFLGAAALWLIEADRYGWALVVFLIAAITDTLDGYVARLLDQATAFGRQLDPMIDKLLIASVLIFLVAEPESGVSAWMASVIVIRELVIQWLRSMMEGRGVAFGSKWAGKMKTVLQCAAIVASLLALSLGTGAPGWVSIARDGLLWAAVLLTIYSGIEYFVAAAPRLREGRPAS